MAPAERVAMVYVSFCGMSGYDLRETDRDFRRYALEDLEGLLSRKRPPRPRDERLRIIRREEVAKVPKAA